MDRKNGKLGLILPSVLLYSILIFGGLFIIFKESLGYIPKLGLNEISLKYYINVLDKTHFRSMVYAIAIAVVSSGFSMIIGAFIAYRMTRSQSIKSSMLFIRFGMVLPYLYMIFIVTLSFSQSGLLSRLCHNLGLITSTDVFPNLIYGFWGIVLTFTLKGIPFVALLTYNVMRQISSRFDDVALTLGGSKWQIFKTIYLPLTRDTIVWSGMVLYIYQIGAFEVPYLLNKIKYQSFAVKIYSSYLSPKISDIPQTMALSILLFFVGLITSALYAIALRYLIKKVAE